jgi:hypothetical protein
MASLLLLSQKLEDNKSRYAYMRFTISSAQSNNSFNRSANSVDFIRETYIISAVRRARLIRALDTLRLVNALDARPLALIVSLLRCLRANPPARWGLLFQLNDNEVARLRLAQFLQGQELMNGSYEGEGGLTTHSTRPLDIISFIISPCGVNCVLLARCGLIRALDPLRVKPPRHS